MYAKFLDHFSFLASSAISIPHFMYGCIYVCMFVRLKYLQSWLKIYMISNSYNTIYTTYSFYNFKVRFNSQNTLNWLQCKNSCILNDTSKAL